MALVELRFRRTVLADLAVTWRERLPALRELPEATVEVPLGHEADDPDVVAEQGGTVVRIFSEDAPWVGIADVPERDGSGLRLTVFSVASWLDVRTVGTTSRFLGCTAGTVARAALVEGLSGLPGAPLQLGTFCEAPPHLDEYAFQGQSVLQVLTDLMELTGQEWVLDDALRVSWVPWVARWRDVVLTDADGLLGPLPGTSLREQAREVVQDEQGVDWTVYDLRVPSVWPSRVTVRGQ